MEIQHKALKYNPSAITLKFTVTVIELGEGSSYARIHDGSNGGPDPGTDALPRT